MGLAMLPPTLSVPQHMTLLPSSTTGWEATLPTLPLRLMLSLRSSPRSPPCPTCPDPPRCPAHLQEHPYLRNPAHQWTSPYPPDCPPANCSRNPHPHRPGCFPGCGPPSSRCCS